MGTRRTATCARLKISIDANLRRVTHVYWKGIVGSRFVRVGAMPRNTVHGNYQ